MMKKAFLLLTLTLLTVSTAHGKTARQFTLNLTDDGKAQMVCFLPETPNGKAIVGIPGGGYSMLSNTHEGTLAHEWLNEQGIAYFVVNYRLPKRFPHCERLCTGLGYQSGESWHHGILCRRPFVIGHLDTLPQGGTS